MYKCISCGHTFSTAETWHESHGEELSGCPICSGNYEEAKKCKVCGAWFLSDELSGGVCNECIDDCRKDFKTCYELSEDIKEEVKINNFLATVFPPEHIESVLYQYLENQEKAGKAEDCSVFIDADKNWFGEKLAERTVSK